MNRKVIVLAVGAVLALAACGNLQAVAPVATVSVVDVANTVNDLKIVWESVKASGAPSIAEVDSIERDLATLSADATALQAATGAPAAGKVATVLLEMRNVVSDLAPFVPAVVSVIDHFKLGL